MRVDQFPNLAHQLSTTDVKLRPYMTALIELQSLVINMNREIEQLKTEVEMLRSIRD